VVGAYDAVLIARRSEPTDWEVELGVVIGAEVRYLALRVDGWGQLRWRLRQADDSEWSFQRHLGGRPDGTRRWFSGVAAGVQTGLSLHERG
jgi:hypothetical protein